MRQEKERPHKRRTKGQYLANPQHDMLHTLVFDRVFIGKPSGYTVKPG
jgi:hypothetical protein